MPASAFSVPGMSVANSFRNGYVWVPGGIPIASAGRRKADAVSAAPPRKVLRERVDMRRNSSTPHCRFLFSRRAFQPEITPDLDGTQRDLALPRSRTRPVSLTWEV